MKLAAKLILIFMLGVLGIVSLFSWQTIRRQQEWESLRRQSHASDLVDALTPAITKAYRDGGVIKLQQAVEVSAQHFRGPQLRWVDPSGDEGQLSESSYPQTQITSRKVSSISISDRDGSTITSTYVPLVIDGNDSGGLEVSEPMSNHDDYVRRSIFASLMSLLGVAALSAAVVYWGGIQIVGKPLNKLIEQVNRIGDGDLGQPPALATRDELGRLAAAISQMSHRLGQQRDTIRHADRLGTVGTLAAGVAHELGTPLNVVAGRAGLIAGGKLSPSEIEASAQTIKSEAERMTTIIRQLLDFARQVPSPPTVIDAGEIVSRTCELMEPLAEKSGVRIVREESDSTHLIRGDAAQMQQVVTNLISNAIQAMPDGGRVIVAVELDPSPGSKEHRSNEHRPNEHRSNEHRVCIRVTDEGIGMDADEIGRVFEPFYTTKEIGQGTGLGLSIAYGIVREHGGQIQVESSKGKATTFRVYLPVAVES